MESYPLRKLTKTPEWIAYDNARARCLRTSSPSYANYGGRGIEFRFASFAEWLRELGYRPGPGYSVDRIDTDGHYESGNVRWATRSEQQKNRRTTGL